MPEPKQWMLTALPRDPATGNVVTVRLAGGGKRGYNCFASTDWKAGLERPPAIVEQLGFEDGAFGAGSIVQAIEMRWGGRDAAVKALAALYWRDQGFELHSGPDGDAGGSMTLILAGKFVDVATEPGVLIMKMADPAVALDKPVVSATFGGSGGIEGDVELKGQPKWRAWGECFNVSLRSLKKATNIHVITDPAFPLQAIDQVYDRGNAASALTAVAWAGSIAATLTALEAAVAPNGGAAIAPSIGCIKWWYANPGKLTCDIKGEIGAGYVDKAPAIAAKIAAVAGGPVFDATMLTAANTARPDPAGWLVSDTSATVAGEINSLLAGVSMWWALSAASVIEVGEWKWGASVATLIPASIRREASFKPVSKTVMGWKRNQTQMNRGDIAGAVFLDGVPIDTLRPAEPGADVTATAVPDITGNFTWEVAATHTGAIPTLPLTRRFLAMKGTTDVSATATWTVEQVTGGVAMTIDNASDRGLAQLGTGTSGSGTARIKAVFPSGGGTVEKTIQINVTRADPPSGGGSGATDAETTDLVGTSSTGHVEIATPRLQVRSDASAKVRITLTTKYGGGVNSKTGAFKHAYSTTSSGSLTDLISEVSGSTYSWNGGDPYEGYVNIAEAEFTMPAANTDYWFVPLARRSSGSGTLAFYESFFRARQP